MRYLQFSRCIWTEKVREGKLEISFLDVTLLYRSICAVKGLLIVGSCYSIGGQAFLRTERGKSARLEDFSSALQTIGRKVCVFVLYLCSFISVSACQMVTFSL